MMLDDHLEASCLIMLDDHLRLQESPKCFVSKTQQPLFLVNAPGYHVSWICYTTVVPLLCTCITPLLACCCNLFVLRLEVKHK